MGLCLIQYIFGRGRRYCVWYTRPMSDAHCKHITPQIPYLGFFLIPDETGQKFQKNKKSNRKPDIQVRNFIQN